jgi:hypothetical protein
LAAFGTPKDPIDSNEVFVRQKDWRVKDHAALLPAQAQGPYWKYHAKGLAPHWALLLVKKQNVACSL